MSFEPFDILVTPFPFVDQIGKMKYRPVLVLSSEEYNSKTGCTVFAMITSAKHSSFWNDHKIQNYSNTNLQGECLIRFKIFTLDNSTLKGKIGELNDIDKIAVKKIIKDIF